MRVKQLLGTRRGKTINTGGFFDIKAAEETNGPVVFQVDGTVSDKADVI
jgi:hypothetical protein